MLKDPPRGYQTPNPATDAFPTGTMPILSARVGKPTSGRFKAQRMTDRGSRDRSWYTAASADFAAKSDFHLREAKKY
jgi:hypothetical protein